MRLLGASGAALDLPKAAGEFERVASDLHKSSGAPGLTAAFVLPDGSRHRYAFGIADCEAETEMRPDARMPGGSTGKTIVAATALSAVLDGNLSLDDPLKAILGDEDWYARVPNASGLTLRRLLNHTSGVPDHMGFPETLGFLVEHRQKGGVDWYLPPRDAVALVLDRPAVAPAGQSFFYSDTNYILAGLAIEAATGETLYGRAQRLFLKPLDLNDIEPALKRHFDRIVPGYTDAPPDSPLPRKTIIADGGLAYSPRTEWAGGGFVSSAADLAYFLWNYAGGRAFREDYLNEVQRCVRYSWREGVVGGYGLGLFSADSPLGVTYGHGGYYPGYITQMSYYPKFDIAVGYQMNKSQAYSGYANIVAARVEAAQHPIGPDIPLTSVTDWSARLAAAVVGLELDA
jgi:D-alanyl-D-alanine carboxypeptidase